MWALTFALFVAFSQTPQSSTPAAPAEADFVMKDFRFSSGETLPELRIHYRTYGTPHKNAQGVVDNAVLVMHGTGGTGAQFVRSNFAAELFGTGQPLDVSKYFIILPDDIGHGGSSKPSDGLRAKFPRYGYADMVTAEYRLVTEKLGVNHLRLVMGTSMGGMHTWMWGSRYPDFMDALMPLASVPTQIAGRNRAWRRVVIDAIRNDPEWKGGDYETQPSNWVRVAPLSAMFTQNVVRIQETGSTREKADAFYKRLVENAKKGDANNRLYQIESTMDYDPAADLEKIKAKLWRSTSPTTR